MKTQAIIPTAGSGTRMKADRPKPFIEIKGKPLFTYCLAAFEQSPSIDSVIVVGEKARLKELETIVKKQGFKKICRFVAGGERRCDSVANGLQAVDVDTGCVVVHDSARPLVTVEIIEAVVKAGKTRGAASAGVPVKPTIKRVNPKTGAVEETLDRSVLWETQTPQAFKKNVLVRAHARDKADNPTDDAVLVEKMGEPVVMIMGGYGNIKVTTPEDIALAEALLA